MLLKVGKLEHKKLRHRTPHCTSMPGISPKQKSITKTNIKQTKNGICNVKCIFRPDCPIMNFFMI